VSKFFFIFVFYCACQSAVGHIFVIGAIQITYLLTYFGLEGILNAVSTLTTLN